MKNKAPHCPVHVAVPMAIHVAGFKRNVSGELTKIKREFYRCSVAGCPRVQAVEEEGGNSPMMFISWGGQLPDRA